ncbi:MAG TPA: ankyrin repeat domain-containing protein [Patescibacteria group bacterium]|nr:ankyrin repeat domain-containing protein [Patescibacteria group bacterium]
MMVNKLLVVTLLALAVLVSGCSRGPEDAKKDLSQMNVQYSEQSFINVIEKNDVKAVKLFLEAGMNPNSVTAEGTPLLTAAAAGNLEIAKLLVEKGGNVNEKDKDGMTPLMAAIFGEKDGTPKQEMVKYLLEKGADLNTRFITNGVGLTPLMAAAGAKDLEVVKILLSKKIDINAPDVNTGMTPLMLATTNDNVEIVKELLSKGADVNKKGKANMTALGLAMQNNNAEMIKVLKNAGAK